MRLFKRLKRSAKMDPAWGRLNVRKEGEIQSKEVERYQIEGMLTN